MMKLKIFMMFEIKRRKCICHLAAIHTQVKIDAKNMQNKTLITALYNCNTLFSLIIRHNSDSWQYR